MKQIFVLFKRFIVNNTSQQRNELSHNTERERNKNNVISQKIKHISLVNHLQKLKHLMKEVTENHNHICKLLKSSNFRMWKNL